MMMGVCTSFITMFSNSMRAARLLVGEFSHVLMRTPFMVPWKVMSVTWMLVTS
uniref:Uncharacterized protein n=1 Tax=Triticum urartu TaxID=4572 RepID=A0A8R7PK50_TRIUA